MGFSMVPDRVVRRVISSMGMLLLVSVYVEGIVYTPITIVHFGFNTAGNGFTDLVDLKDKLQQVRDLYPNVIVLNPTGLEHADMGIEYNASAVRFEDLTSGNVPANSTLIGANANFHGLHYVYPSVVIRTGSGFLVGVVGYLSGPRSPVEAVRQEATKLKAAGVPVVLALGDAGYPEDQRVALEVEQVDAVVAGPERGDHHDGYPIALKKTSGDGKAVPFLKAPDSSLCVTQMAFSNDGLLLAWNGFLVKTRSGEQYKTSST